MIKTSVKEVKSLVQIPKRGKDPFLKAHHVENDDLVAIVAPAYVHEGDFGERTVVNVVVKRTGEIYRWTLNGTTSDRCREAWSPDGALWENKVLKIQKSKQIIRGEDKEVLYGVPYREPQQPLAE